MPARGTRRTAPPAPASITFTAIAHDEQFPASTDDSERNRPSPVATLRVPTASWTPQTSSFTMTSHFHEGVWDTVAGPDTEAV